MGDEGLLAEGPQHPVEFGRLLSVRRVDRHRLAPLVGPLDIATDQGCLLVRRAQLDVFGDLLVGLGHRVQRLSGSRG